MKLDLKPIKISLLIGFVLVISLYLFTLHRQDLNAGSKSMTRQILQPLYIGETGFKNKYAAGELFESHVTFPGGDGCPCYGTNKIVVLLKMLLTWQFYVNWLLWSIPFVGIVLMGDKYAHSGIDFRKIIIGFGVLVLGLILSTLVTVYTAKVDNNHTTQTDQGCVGISYIASGFPVRDIFIQDYKGGGDCGIIYVEMGNTMIGGIPWLLNWIFWSGMIASTPRIIRKLKRHENNRH